MFKEEAEVIDKKDGKLKIKFSKRIMCSGCSFNFLCPSLEEEIFISDNPDYNLKAGDKLEISIEDKKALWAGFLLFFMPAVIFIFTLLVFKDSGGPKSFVLGILTVSGYYFLIKQALRKIKPDLNFKILRKI